MKFVPVSADTVSANGLSADPARAARDASPRRLLLQAALLGLCGGLFIVGMIENATRLSAPERLSNAYAEQRLAAEGGLSEPAEVATQSDRLDVQR
ncbi:MAG: hypothetical protein AAGH43_03450 [Pseudomonadota bacterium]